MIFSLNLEIQATQGGSKFRNLIGFGKKLIEIDQKKMKFDFVQNQICFALIDEDFFLKSAPIPSNINIQGITHE